LKTHLGEVHISVALRGIEAEQPQEVSGGGNAANDIKRRSQRRENLAACVDLDGNVSLSGFASRDSVILEAETRLLYCQRLHAPAIE
jgi:hypothetical protein